jgi:CRISPR/Cas system-associated endoribonuclease Cas2
MAAYIVTYDLHKSGQNYACIKEKLESYPSSWHMQGSVWIIKSSKNANSIRDDLTSCLDQNDNLLVAKLHGEAAWYGFGTKGSDWLKSLLEAQL